MFAQYSVLLPRAPMTTVQATVAYRTGLKFGSGFRGPLDPCAWAERHGGGGMR